MPNPMLRRLRARIISSLLLSLAIAAIEYSFRTHASPLKGAADSAKPHPGRIYASTTTTIHTIGIRQLKPRLQL